MAIPDPSALAAAQRLLARYFQPTPLVPGPDGLLLKLETVLPTGSFKPRGALFALASRLAAGGVEEVVASSTGNHGAAVAWAAKTLGVPATIFLPTGANPVKRDKITALGARVLEVAAPDLTGAAAAAAAYAASPGVYFLNDVTDPAVPAGTATIGLEILAQRPDIAAIFVPMGDTALIRGVAAAVKPLAPLVRVIGVQAERAACYYLSFHAGRPVSTPSCDTIADGLATRTPHPDNVAALRGLVDDVLLVSEDDMLAAMRRLWREVNVLAEPSGAAATAAFLRHPCARAVALVTGANISPEVRRRALGPEP